MRNLAVKVPTDLWLEFKVRVGAPVIKRIAMRWRLAPRSELIVLGDVNSGYVVALVREKVIARLRKEAVCRGVSVDANH